ncbi:PPE family protein, partial [Mycobacterium asiaticum]|uniref:PPE family protein n=1 Tax=Mycobacterium asiaticum TaxID=1790 RepID=UPI000A994521
MEFPVLPPEINSALIYAGAGTGPLLKAAQAWQGLGAELWSAAASFGSVTSGLTEGAWQGPAAAAMAEVAGPYVSWLSAAAAQAETTAAQAEAVASAFETAVAAVAHPLAVAANRSELVRLALSNIFGLNAPAIAATEAAYEQMWAQDVAAIFEYHAGASVIAAALTPFVHNPTGLAGTAAAIGAAAGEKAMQLNAGIANVGNYNLGLGNVGQWNVGAGNLGAQNLGFANSGTGNFGFGNVGNGNIGFGNAALGAFLGGNIGFANTGANNFGFANTGNNNIGIGLSGDNQTGISGLNTGTGNIGLFNSGTNNVGFFNSGTGNFGLFNSGNYNSGVGNSGLASTGLFNAGNFNTGLANVGNYNTGTLNVGSFNSGDFNPGHTNTGWLNTGNTNTGIANSGNVNTGAFIAGNQSNGVLWVGDNEGLIGFASGTRVSVIPLDLGIFGGIGPITLRPIPIIPTIPLNIHHTFFIPPLAIPDIVIPPIGGGTAIPISIGPVTEPAESMVCGIVTIPNRSNGPAGKLAWNTCLAISSIGVMVTGPMLIGIAVPPPIGGITMSGMAS